MTERKDPEYVSFTDAADLVVRRGFVGNMTPRGLRKMAVTRGNKKMPAERRWPFGDGPGQEPYLTAGRTRMMRTARLLEYLAEHPPTGRGPGRRPSSDR